MRRTRSFQVLLLALASRACASAPPAERPENPDSPRRELPGAVSPPPGHAPPPCELELSTAAVRRGSSYDVTAYVKNVSSRTITFELPDRCPAGPAIFHGLPNGYDYHQTCTKGACAERSPRRFSARAGERIEIDAVTIDPGGGGCNPPLPAGSHHVAFGIPYEGATCSSPWAAIGLR